jgi:hypothetical protein
VGFKADYYEALTWHVLSRIHGASNVRYEPDRDIHTCGRLCPRRGSCDKPQQYPRLIYTVPDFYVQRPAKPLFAHVFYWDSKETSHAKFWRTVSELAELRSFVPGSESLCVVFETSLADGIYHGNGWYPEFLKGLHLLADWAVFYTAPDLEADLERLRERLPARAGTARIYEEVSAHAGEYRAVVDLESLVRSARHPSPRLRRAVQTVWQREVDQCATLPYWAPREHKGRRLRDATLQIVLLTVLLDWPAKDVLRRLAALYHSSNEPFPDRLRMVDWMSRLPVRYRDGEYTFLAGDVQEFGDLPIRCVLSEDLTWMVRALKANRFPLPPATFQNCLEEIAAAFKASAQVREAVTDIRSTLALPPASYASRSAEDWVDAYDSFPTDLEYNQPAELLLATIGLGTYPLVRAYNERYPAAPITRDNIRGLYSNRRSAQSAARRRQVVRSLAGMIPAEVDWPSVHVAYTHRKVKRIVGPQSDINPMDYFVRDLLRTCALPAGFALVHDVTVETFASSVTEGIQLGTWRVALALRSAREIIPFFTSAMRDRQDCAHKVREFTGHLRLARHRLTANGVTGTEVRRGIAVLEGGYDDDDKRAFYLAGYHVCSLDTLREVITGLR